MKKKIFKLSLQYLFAASCITSLFSCSKMLEVEPANAVASENAYQNIYDADVAVTGVYGKFMNIAAQHEVLNELRADLLDVTTNAGPFLKEINTHQVSADNPYANPRPYYEVIMNCNDVLKNLQIMVDNKKITQNDFIQRYSDIGALRSWLYFQLGIHFGEIPYVTSTLEDVSDLKDDARFPKYRLNVLVDTLISYMESLPYKDPYPAGSSLVTQIDGYPSSMFFVNKNCLLGDLYLWSNKYNQAASYYKRVLETTTPLGQSAGYTYFNWYMGTSGTDNDAVTASAWQTWFSRSPQDREYQAEWIWTLFFDKNFKPGNPFIDLFSISGGQYLLKPSQAAIDYYEAQQQKDGTPVDYRGPNNTYRIVNGQPQVMKFLYNYLNTGNSPVSLLEKNGKWFLYRASLMHLRYSEAANREGHDKIAYAFINDGIRSAYNVNPNSTDPTQKQATFLPFPYDLDARKIDAPTIRGKHHRNLGLRGRVSVAASTIDSARYFDMSVPSNPNKAVTDRAGLTVYMEDKLLTEAALETAYEGNRWQDLMRIAIRRNDPAYLADKVYNKLLKAGNPAAASVRAKLMNPDNWYLPFKMK
jgi:hypothetical protein